MAFFCFILITVIWVAGCVLLEKYGFAVPDSVFFSLPLFVGVSLMLSKD
jgi:hypothetical protein